jgi:hypothetical protein
MSLKPQDTGKGNNDWKEAFRIIKGKRDLNKIVEFGLGEGSKLLKKKCNYLHSIEIVVNQEQFGWADYVASELKDYGENYRQSVIEYTDTWDDTLQAKIDEVFEEEYDLAFVDSGCHCRGELVNYCLRKNIPIVMAHDTNHGFDKYGWDLIDNRDLYKKVSFPDGEGTSVYVLCRK